jgi:hypothetical protein
MAGWVKIAPVSFNSGAGGTAFPALPPGTPGYDTGSPGGTFTAWGSASAVLIPNNGLVILAYWCGATAAGVTDVLVGQQVGNTGLVLPAGTETYSIGASTSGWLGPWNANTYNVQNVNASWGSVPGTPGTPPASAVGCVAVAFTTLTSLAVRAYQILQA